MVATAVLSLPVASISGRVRPVGGANSCGAGQDTPLYEQLVRSWINWKRLPRATVDRERARPRDGTRPHGGGRSRMTAALLPTAAAPIRAVAFAVGKRRHQSGLSTRSRSVRTCCGTRTGRTTPSSTTQLLAHRLIATSRWHRPLTMDGALAIANHHLDWFHLAARGRWPTCGHVLLAVTIDDLIQNLAPPLGNWCTSDQPRVCLRG